MKLAALFAALIATAVDAPSGPTMKAIVAHQWGGPEVLKVEDVPRPEPKENEILINLLLRG